MKKSWTILIALGIFLSLNLVYALEYNSAGIYNLTKGDSIKINNFTIIVSDIVKEGNIEKVYFDIGGVLYNTAVGEKLGIYQKNTKDISVFIIAKTIDSINKKSQIDFIDNLKTPYKTEIKNETVTITKKDSIFKRIADWFRSVFH